MPFTLFLTINIPRTPKDRGAGYVEAVVQKSESGGKRRKVKQSRPICVVPKQKIKWGVLAKEAFPIGPHRYHR